MESNSRIEEVNQMIKFILGLMKGVIIGLFTGIAIMCLLQINRGDDYNEQ